MEIWNNIKGFRSKDKLAEKPFMKNIVVSTVLLLLAMVTQDVVCWL